MQCGCWIGWGPGISSVATHEGRSPEHRSKDTFVERTYQESKTEHRFAQKSQTLIVKTPSGCGFCALSEGEDCGDLRPFTPQRSGTVRGVWFGDKFDRGDGRACFVLARILLSERSPVANRELRLPCYLHATQKNSMKGDRARGQNKRGVCGVNTRGIIIRVRYLQTRIFVPSRRSQETTV